MDNHRIIAPECVLTDIVYCRRGILKCKPYMYNNDLGQEVHARKKVANMKYKRAKYALTCRMGHFRKKLRDIGYKNHIIFKASLSHLVGEILKDIALTRILG